LQRHEAEQCERAAEREVGTASGHIVDASANGRDYRDRHLDHADERAPSQPQAHRRYLAGSRHCSTRATRHISHERYNYSSSRNDTEVFVLAELLRDLTSATDEETTPRELPTASRAQLQPAQAIKAAMRRGRFLFSTTG
jgi:hypothetical protein